MMKMMMVKRSVVTSHKAEGRSPSLLSPFVNVQCKVLFIFIVLLFILYAIVFIYLVVYSKCYCCWSLVALAAFCCRLCFIFAVVSAVCCCLALLLSLLLLFILNVYCSSYCIFLSLVCTAGLSFSRTSDGALTECQLKEYHRLSVASLQQRQTQNGV